MHEHGILVGLPKENFSISTAAKMLPKSSGPLANHRPPDKSSAGVNDTSFYEQLEYHRWSSEDWGLASEAFDEVWLTAACRGAPLAWSAEGEAECNGDNVWTTSLAAGSAGNSRPPWPVAMARPTLLLMLVVRVSTGSPSHLHGDLHQPVSVRAYHPPVVCECAGAIDAAEPREAPGGGEEQACAGGSRMVRHLVQPGRNSSENHILLSCRANGSNEGR